MLIITLIPLFCHSCAFNTMCCRLEQKVNVGHSLCTGLGPVGTMWETFYSPLGSSLCAEVWANFKSAALDSHTDSQWHIIIVGASIWGWRRLCHVTCCSVPGKCSVRTVLLLVFLASRTWGKQKVQVKARIVTDFGYRSKHLSCMHWISSLST